MANLKLVTEPFDGASLLRALRALHGERDLAAAAKRILSELAVLIGAQRGVLYVQRGEGASASRSSRCSGSSRKASAR